MRSSRCRPTSRSGSSRRSTRLPTTAGSRRSPSWTRIDIAPPHTYTDVTNRPNREANHYDPERARMTDFTCGSGTRYGAGPETKFTLTSEQFKGAAVVLVIERNGRYRWGNPIDGGRSAFDVANYLTQIAGHIL